MICSNHPDVTEGIRDCAGCANPFCSDCLVEMQTRPYCASCKSEQLIDLMSGVDRTQLEYASVWKRFGGVVVDTLLLAAPAYAALAWVIIPQFAQAASGKPPSPWFDFIGLPFVFVAVIYEGTMLQKKSQTLGKMAMQLRVVRADGSRISTGQAWGRAVAKTLLGYLWFIEYLPAFFTKEKTTLHDLIAGTRVVEL
jgi:uncharacterized RDD family membrane protein YckC